MEKSPDAFRTISEVAEWLDIPTHVLRFWESRFSQIKPVKRAGGRRYYRPSDMLLIGGVKTLLHDQGMTIRGVQKILREQGIKHVSSFSPALGGDLQDDEDVIEHQPAPAADVRAPAPAAAQTRSAEPAPVAPSPAPEPDDAEEQFDMFPEDASEPEPEHAAETEPDAPQVTRIPATAGVPKVDAEDDDPRFPDTPGIAARLATRAPASFAAHRAVARQAAERLRALRDRSDV